MFVADWLPRQNNKKNKDNAIPGLNINIDTNIQNRDSKLHDYTTPTTVKRTHYKRYGMEVIDDIILKKLNCTQRTARLDIISTAQKPYGI